MLSVGTEVDVGYRDEGEAGQDLDDGRILTIEPYLVRCRTVTEVVSGPFAIIRPAAYADRASLFLVLGWLYVI
jgi:hypothetical protein